MTSLSVRSRAIRISLACLALCLVFGVSVWEPETRERGQSLGQHADRSSTPASWDAGTGVTSETSVSVQVSARDAWEGSEVLYRKRTYLGSSEDRYRQRRVVKHPDIRYAIFVEEFVQLSSEARIVERDIVREIAAEHFLLTPNPSAAIEEVRKAMADLGLVVGDAVSMEGPVRVSLPRFLEAPVALISIVAEMNSGAYSNIVDHADYDFVRRIALAPDDAYFESGDQWGLLNDGARAGSLEGVDIGASEGWDIRTDASNVVVAIVDTGARYSHEDLSGNMWVNSGEIAGNGIDDDANGFVDDIHGMNALLSSELPGGGDPIDDNGHGTHVAGTVGAVGNNGIGVTGVAWHVQLMPLRFLGASGAGMDSDAIACIDYAIQNGADIINNSWGGEGVNRALIDAVQRANEAGIIFVAAAGNGYDDIDINAFTPAGIDLPNVVTVGNHDDGNNLHLTSNYGREKVDLLAPGTRIRSTTQRTDSSYGIKTGTSMSTPHVSGILALLKAEYSE